MTAISAAAKARYTNATEMPRRILNRPSCTELIHLTIGSSSSAISSATRNRKTT